MADDQTILNLSGTGHNHGVWHPDASSIEQTCKSSNTVIRIRRECASMKSYRSWATRGSNPSLRKGITPLPDPLASNKMTKGDEVRRAWQLENLEGLVRQFLGSFPRWNGRTASGPKSEAAAKDIILPTVVEFGSLYLGSVCTEGCSRGKMPWASQAASERGLPISQQKRHIAALCYFTLPLAMSFQGPCAASRLSASPSFYPTAQPQHCSHCSPERLGQTPGNPASSSGQATGTSLQGCGSLEMSSQ